MELTLINEHLSGDLSKYGQAVYQKNPMFKQVAEFMEHPMCREFYKTCLNNSNRDSTMFFLWLYEQIEKYEPSLKPYEKLALLDKIMRTSAVREKIVDSYSTISKQNVLEDFS